MKIEKLNNISFIKVTMMLLIVLYHSLLFFGGTWFTVIKVVYKSRFLYAIALWFNTFHIHTFAMASGYLFYYYKDKKNISHKQNIIKKINRLIVPYIFVGLLWVIPFKYFLEGNDICSQLVEFVLGIANEQLWFLMMLFILYLIFEFIFKKISVSRMNLLIILVVSSIIYYILTFNGIYYYQIHNVFCFIPFFYLGGYLYVTKYKYNYNKVYWLLLGGSILAIMLSALKNSNPFIENILMHSFSMIEVILIYVLCDYLTKKNSKIINNKLFLFLENYSYGIYLFHMQIIFICIVLLNGHIYPLVQVILSFMISIIVSIIITYGLTRIKLTSFLIGYKVDK